MAVVGMMVAVAGCASSPPMVPLDLKAGLSAEAVRASLGEPDAAFLSEFGDETSEGKWIGMVWIYFGERDPEFKLVKRRVKDTYVFYPPEGQMRLNHFVLESRDSNSRTNRHQSGR